MGNLTAVVVKNAKPKAKKYRLSDEGGLFLEVTPKGSKYWRFSYRIHGKQKTLALGVYPEISLADARDAHFKARKLRAEGIDPGEAKKKEKLAARLMVENSFKAVSERWYAHHFIDKSESYKARSKRILVNDLYPSLGTRPINDITAPEVLAVLRKIEERTVDIAHRAKELFGLIFRWSIQEGYVDTDPTFGLKGALKPRNKKHYSAITTIPELSRLLKDIDNCHATITVKIALQLAPLLFQRPGELRNMKWSAINWQEARWELSASDMKMRHDHLVPLSKQAIELLQSIYQITGDGIFVFPSARGRSRPLSDNGLRTALRNMGYTNDDVTPHGFRATARTILDEQLGYRIDIIEQQLAHAVKDPLGRAYNRTKFWDQRMEMMQTWADFLDAIKDNPKLNKEEIERFKQD